MIGAVVCRCSGAVTIVRKFLYNHNVKDWNSIPVAVGRIDAVELINTLPDEVGVLGPDNPIATKNFVDNNARFIIIFGYDDKHFMWSDISRGNAKAVIDAEIIIKRFA